MTKFGPACPDLELLQRFISRQISEVEAGPLESHLADCQRCSDAIKALAVDDDLLASMRSEARSSLGEDAVPTGLTERLEHLWETSSGVVQRAADSHDGASNHDGSIVDVRTARVYDFLEPPSTGDAIGQFGEYSVRQVIGRGGMGVVFLAVDQRLGREVALKVLLDARYIDSHYLARFQRDAESLSHLQHPNIVRVYEAGEHSGRPFLAMEHVIGGNLAQAIAGRPMPIDESAALIEVVGRAVHYAHSQGVLHHDLKPGNILIDKLDHRPLIADFGLAQHDDTDGQDLTHTSDILGTPGYMAPELAAGAKNSSEAVDVYSLGAILYELITARPPFRGETAFETLQQARLWDPIPLRRLRPVVPKDIETICLKCLEREPAKRYSNAAELCDDLARYLRHEPILARPVSIPERALKWAGRHRTASVLIATVFLSLVAITSVSVWHSERMRTTLARVEQERARADLGYQSARETLNQMLHRLERRPVGDVPQLRELQRELLEDSLAFYQRVLKNAEGPDPGVQRDRAAACERAGAIATLLGRWDEAESHFTSCLTLIDRLPAEMRATSEIQMLLAACHNNIGQLTNNSRRWKEAEDHYRIALGINESLAKAQPALAAHQYGIGDAALNLGAIYQLAGKMSEAEPFLVRAHEEFQHLIQQFPGDERYQQALAKVFVNLAVVRQNTGRVDLAIKGLEAADALLRPLVARYPPGGEDALTLAAVCNNLAECLRGMGQTEKAIVKTSEAIDLTEAILRQEPKHSVARATAYNSHGIRAQLYETLGRHSEAAAEWDRVIELDTQPDAWVRRIFGAMSLARAGESPRAAAAADSLVASANVSADGLYALACVYAVSAQPSDSDVHDEAQQEDSFVERCESRAVSLLRKLHDHEYFKAAQHAELLRSDPDLDALRDRSDFGELSKEVFESTDGSL